MVGTLLKMIVSPNVKPLDKSKTSPRRSPIQASIEKANSENSESINVEDEIAVRPGQNGGNEDHETVGAFEDDDIDEDVTDSNSTTFQCACKVWSCTQCHKAFSSARALKIHEVKQHENMPKRYIKCNHCDEVFDHGNLLQIHMKVHHNIKVQCARFKDLSKPINSKGHHAEPMCPVCGVKFDHDKLLKLHMEHYHKVPRNDSLPTEAGALQQTLQPVSTLLSPNSKPMDSRSLSPDSRKHTPSPRQMEGRFSRSFYETNSDDSNSRSSVSPREVHSDREICDGKQMFDQQFNSGLYTQRPILGVPRNAYYLPYHDNGPVPYGPLSFYPQGVRRSIEKRPLGRSHSLPLKQDTVYADVPLMPWQIPDTGYPVIYGMSREKKIDRAALEAVRNSLKAKLRSVEETLLREETESHQPLSPTLHNLYDNQRYFGGCQEDVIYPHRPTVITPRNTFGGIPFKRQAPPSDLEPTEKIRALDKSSDTSLSPSQSPSRPITSFIPQVKESVIPRIYEPRDVPKVSRDDLAIPNLQRQYFDNQTKIFIKRGAPRCNRCQQTFCSKMEYLHHLISHREKDGLVDASPEEMEFIEDVKRSMESKNFVVGEIMENRHGPTSTNSLGCPSPKDKSTLEAKEKNSDQNTESISEDKSLSTSPSSEDPSSLPLGTECVECKDVFADSASYQSHVEKRHMKPRCRECGLTFDHKNLLKIHMDCYHSSVEVLQCYYCGMSFKQRRAFLDHVTSHESQDISNKERVNEQNSDPSEQGGRRRWGRLVASAQLPAEKLDVSDQDGDGANHRLGVRDVLALKSHTKQKLRKTVSLSAYTDMINRQKKSHVQFLQEMRSKGDEAIGKEMRTRIFLPNFQDKMENLSRFASSSVQLAKKRISPPPLEKPVQGNEDYLFRRQNLPPGQEDVTPHFYTGERRTTHATGDAKPFPYVAQKRKLERLKRSAPVEEDTKAGLLDFPLRKAFVRDDVENLYQMRHKKAFHNSEVSNSLVPDPLDHRNALVKIERVEVDPASRQTSPNEPPTSEMADRLFSSTSQQYPGTIDSTDTSMTLENSSVIKNVAQPTVSTIEPPPLIDVRSTQSATATTATDLHSSSSRPETPCASPSNFESKTKLESSPPSPLTGDPSEKETKGKRRNSIKRLTKEALINSLSLKRRSSAPDLYQLHREQSNENRQDENSAKPEASPGSPSPRIERNASPSSDTKHHGSRSLYYTPRKQSDRDVTCVQCGVSFGHKKLYKIHLDSYHGQQAEHQCLQCGAKNFQDKDEFVKHLMAHQNKGKVSNAFTNQDSSTTDQELDFKKEIHSGLPSELTYGHDLSPNIRKLKDSLGESSEFASSDEERSHLSSQTSSSEQLKSIDSSKAYNNIKVPTNKKTTCLLCGKVFENGKQLEQHFSSHAMISKDGRFCCVICKKPFETLRKLEVHSRSHTGFKPHKCEQCGRCFPYYSSYYYHKMTHTKDRPHKCPVCGKGFIQTRYLRSHLATHKDEQGTISDEVEGIIKKAELTMNDETDEESIDSPGTVDGSPGYRANDEETATAEILCSFKWGLSCSAQNSESELSPAMPSSCKSVED